MLTGRLGDPHMETLTARQFHTLRRRMAEAALDPGLRNQELDVSHVRKLGLPQGMAEQVLRLLGREEQLERYLLAADRQEIFPLTRLDAYYPQKLEKLLGDSAPPALYCRGDITLLSTKCISLVGSRRLEEEGRAFAREIGRLCAKEGHTLVSGGAVGADREAQEACLAHGGRVIVFTPDSLLNHPMTENVLYCSEEGFDEAFSAQRALSRNRLIHAMGERTFVARCTPGKGGTWHGTAENLRNGYSPVCVYDDGSPGVKALCTLGATATDIPQTLKERKHGQLKFDE